MTVIKQHGTKCEKKIFLENSQNVSKLSKMMKQKDINTLFIPGHPDIISEGKESLQLSPVSCVFRIFEYHNINIIHFCGLLWGMLAILSTLDS